MYKILLTLVALSLIFVSCGKEQDLSSKPNEEKVTPNTNINKYQGSYYKIGFSLPGDRRNIEWSSKHKLSSNPSFSEFQSGHSVKVWASEKGLHHLWQRFSGKDTGFSSHILTTKSFSPYAIAQNESELEPKNNGTIWFQLVQ
jgi:hypothetical protein